MGVHVVEGGQGVEIVGVQPVEEGISLEMNRRQRNSESRRVSGQTFMRSNVKTSY